MPEHEVDVYDLIRVHNDKYSSIEFNILPRKQIYKPSHGILVILITLDTFTTTTFTSDTTWTRTLMLLFLTAMCA